MRGKLIYPVIIVFASAFFAASLVFAAGGGGGGGGGGIAGCSGDTWSCSAWSPCSIEGSQTRTCQKSFDCPEFDTPKPAEQQECTPACVADTFNCSLWSDCSDDGIQTRTCRILSDCPIVETPTPPEQQTCAPSQTQPEPEPEPDPEPAFSEPQPEREPKPQAEQKKEPAPAPAPAPVPVSAPKSTCSADTWECGAWSESCDTFGNHKRECTRTFDCSGVETQQPEAFKRCEKLQCGQLENMRDRIECRLKLTPAGIARELEIEYLPEECRSYSDEEKQFACIQLYESFDPCWDMEKPNERFVCARNIVDLGDNPKQEMKQFS